MRELIVIDGQKGGVGKTTCARVVVDWLVERRGQGTCAVYDADGVVGDLSRFHRDQVVEVTLTDVASVAAVLDGLFDPAQPDVAVVDLGAGSRQAAHDWLEHAGALEAAERGDIALTILFMMGEGVASVALLADALERLRCPWAFVAVLNLGAGDQFAAFEASRTRQRLMDGGGRVMVLPRLPSAVYQRVDALSVPFADFASGAAGARFTESHYTATWLRQAFAAIDQAEVGRAGSTAGGRNGNNGG